MWTCIFVMCFVNGDCAQISSDPYKDVNLAVIEIAVNATRVDQVSNINGKTWFPKYLMCTKKNKVGI